MSLIGTKLPSGDGSAMVAIEARADIERSAPNSLIPALAVFRRRYSIGQIVWQKLIQKSINNAIYNQKTYKEAGTDDSLLNRSAVRRKVVGKWLKAEIPSIIDGLGDRRKDNDNRENNTTADASPHERNKPPRG